MYCRVWHDGLWQVRRRFHIDEGLVQVIKESYINASSAILLNGQMVDFNRN
ncbi:hypothetical protein DPMN_017530 [Dreissena polymorpha]|uniref:Uncharacterized protein n=1 Tax=Dreissena polymorpha TaxID=45954 RepID=A0A9D4S7J1_DREPO|nr:hypothetical protein DPMN_017530 [Dreissena polymorpha]